MVMRTASQLGISTEHLIPLEKIVESLHDDQERFPCLSRLLRQPGAQIDTALSYQGKVKRISVYTDEAGKKYYYAIKGLLGGVKFDSRVVKTLTKETAPPYAVHFSKGSMAADIWNQKETTSHWVRAKGLPILTGAICKFDLPIHALTNIEHRTPGWVLSNCHQGHCRQDGSWY